MTDKLRQAAEMALEALDCLPWQASPIAKEATQALRQALAEPANSTTNLVEPKALAQPEQETFEYWKAVPAQEPIGWMTLSREGFRFRLDLPTNDVPLGWIPIYTIPPSIEAAVLAEREACAKVCDDADKSTHPADLANAIRARGEK